jgi:hypothetical protein
MSTKKRWLRELTLSPPPTSTSSATPSSTLRSMTGGLHTTRVMASYNIVSTAGLSRQPPDRIRTISSGRTSYRRVPENAFRPPTMSSASQTSANHWLAGNMTATRMTVGDAKKTRVMALWPAFSQSQPPTWAVAVAPPRGETERKSAGSTGSPHSHHDRRVAVHESTVAPIGRRTPPN